MEPVFGERLAARGARRAPRAAPRRPHDFVAQEQVTLSTAPVWDGDRLEPRHVVLRSLRWSPTASGYGVMPGGLDARRAYAHDPLGRLDAAGRRQQGHLGARRTARCSTSALLRPPGEPRRADARRAASSRAASADNLFWLGRYVERAEGTVRLLARDPPAHRRASRIRGPRPGSRRCSTPSLPPWRSPEPLVPAADVVDGAVLERALAELARADEPERALRPTVAAAHRLAAIVRDRISPDTWRVLTELERGLAALAARRGPPSAKRSTSSTGWCSRSPPSAASRPTA